MPARLPAFMNNEPRIHYLKSGMLVDKFLIIISIILTAAICMWLLHIISKQVEVFQTTTATLTPTQTVYYVTTTNKK